MCAIHFFWRFLFDFKFCFDSKLRKNIFRLYRTLPFFDPNFFFVAPTKFLHLRFIFHTFTLTFLPFFFCYFCRRIAEFFIPFVAKASRFLECVEKKEKDGVRSVGLRMLPLFFGKGRKKNEEKGDFSPARNWPCKVVFFFNSFDPSFFGSIAGCLIHVGWVSQSYVDTIPSIVIW